MNSNARLWGAVTAAFMANGAFYGLWAGRIPAIANRFDLSHADLAVFLLVLASSTLISIQIFGQITDRRGASSVTRWGLMALAGSVLLLALSPNLWLLGLSLICVGASLGAMDVAMNSWANEVEKHADRIWMPSFHAMWSLGTGLGAASGALAAAANMGYPIHFALITALTLGLALWGITVPWTSKLSDPKDNKLFPIPKGGLLFAALFCFCATMGEGGMADWSALFLRDTTQSSESFAPLGFAVFSAAMFMARLAGGTIIRLFGSVKSAMFSGVSATIGTAIVIGFATPYWSLVGFVFMGLGYALAVPLGFRRAGNDPHIPPAQAIASVATLGYGGMLISPPIIGFLAQATDLRIAFGSLFALAVAMLVLAPRLRT